MRRKVSFIILLLYYFGNIGEYRMVSVTVYGHLQSDWLREWVGFGLVPGKGSGQAFVCRGF